MLNKKFFGMVDHFVIYLGLINFQHMFVANYIQGVKVIPNHELDDFLKIYVPSKIEKFPGAETQRGEALKRAMSLIGQRAYNYVANNCEHFKNFVHYGIKKSTQVQKVGGAVAIGGMGVTLIGLDKRNNGMTLVGIFIVLIGIIVALLGDPDNNKQRKVDY
ncbi:MAG TPA: lecithin retinol acyltransferase family protein [Cyclobacteriaceae bacterium]|nr:lecithin retinol acyltransferase family protein [Cyclobacteriaceae bacterium]